MKRRSARARHIPFLPAAVLVFLAAGCTAATDTAGLDAVAKAGIAWAGKVPPLMDRAFELAAAVDSAALVSVRDGLSAEQRRDALRQFDAAMAERLAEYAAAKRHNELLRSYFMALRPLLKPEGSKGIGRTARRLTTELNRLSPRLKKARWGDVSVSGLMEPAAAVAVASFKSAALRREFEARGATMERELAVQQAWITALARQVRADREVLSARFRSGEVTEPYMNAKRLPRTWPARRLRSLRGAGDVEAVEAAERTIRSLRAAYVAAMEGRMDDVRAAELAGTVEGFVELVSRLGAEAGRALR